MKIFEIAKGIEAKFPESWEEMTMGQFFDIGLNFESMTSVELLESLSGIKEEVWLKCSDENIDTVIMPHLTFLFTNDFKPEDYPVLDKITVSGKTIKVPKDLGFETFGQKIICQDEITKSEKDNAQLFKAIPFIVAVYLQPKLGEDFDEEKARALMPEIMQMKVTEIYPIGFFLLMKLVGSLIERLNYLETTNIQRRKLELVSEN